MSNMARQRLRADEWEVCAVPFREASELVAEHHYSGSTANTAVYSHGLLHRDDWLTLRGAALWMPPTKNAAKTVSDDWRGVLHLSRLVVDPDAPRNAASFLLGASMRQIDRVRWHTLLTYADTALGHTGAIYRATNWECLGQVPGSDAWIDADGVRRGRKRGGRNLSAQEMQERGFIRLPAAPKWKFIHRKDTTA